MRLPLRRRVVTAQGQRVLARAVDADGTAVDGTRDALLLPGRDPIPWEQVRGADWDADAEELRVVEIADWGRPDPVHVVRLAETGRLLELVRERVTASVVLSRRVAVDERGGVRLVARRPPGTRRDLTWLVEYDEGLEPDDAAVRAAVEDGLAQARRDVGA